MKEFFNKPYCFSFKDLIAVIFLGMFLYFCWYALKNKDIIELIKVLIPPVCTILGGYFCQEIGSMWARRGQYYYKDNNNYVGNRENESYYSSYNSYDSYDDYNGYSSSSSIVDDTPIVGE